MSANDKIIIIGAGPVGLSCALFLAEHGIDCTILEKEPSLPEDMRASTFHPATLDMLIPSGLDHRLIVQGTLIPQWQYMRMDTGDRAVFDMSVIEDLTSHPYRLQCEQFRLTNLIVEHMPDLDIRFGCEVTEIAQDSDGVTVTCGEGEPITATYAIAADGGKSFVRKALDLPFEGHVFPKTSITAVINEDFASLIPNLLGVNYMWTAAEHFSLMQLRNQWRFTYSPQQDQSIEDAMQDAVIQSHLQKIVPSDSAYDVAFASYYTLHQRCTESFRHGRILLAGDAGHLNSPAGGMGMNSGIHDARCLADHLAPVLNGHDDNLLDRYSRKRRTIAVDEVQKTSAKNYARHRETDPVKREEVWAELKAITDDRDKMRDYLITSSMIASIEKEREIE